MATGDADLIDAAPAAGALVPVPATAAVPAISAEAAALREKLAEATIAWLCKSPSKDTRSNYMRDLHQFLAFIGTGADQVEVLAAVRPHQVAKWRDRLSQDGLTNASIRRKMTALRSLFSYLQSYGFIGANPAHSDFV